MSEHSKPPSNARTMVFVVILCLVCALILALASTSLRGRQVKAKELDNAKQLLEAARLYQRAGFFELAQEGDQFSLANWSDELKILVPEEKPPKATAEEIYALFQSRLVPYVTDSQGHVSTIEEAGIDLQDYVSEYRESGYYKLPQKLFYVIRPNIAPDEKYELPYGYIIPVAGFGLWGPIFGYVALEANADTVIGIAWDAPLETPGLGAIIQEPSWQEQFEGKEIFQPAAEGETNLSKARLGITVVKGKVSEVFGDGPRSHTSVDGITGATLTCNGVTEAYSKSLAPYRPLLIEANKAYTDEKPFIEAP